MTLLDSGADDADSSLDLMSDSVVSAPTGLGDIIYGAIRESGTSDVPLGSLLSVLAAKGSIPCVYNRANYTLRFDTSRKTPQVMVSDVATNASWIVSLSSLALKAMYGSVASSLNLSAVKGDVRAISCGIRGGVAGAIKALLNRGRMDFADFDGPVSVDRVSNLVGSRIFDPERKSRVLKITKN